MWPAFSSTKIVPGCIWSGIHSLRTSSSATISPSSRANLLLRTQFQPADGTDLFRSTPARTLPTADHGFHLANRVAQADGKHRLPGIFQDVHDLLRRGFEVKRAAIRQQVIAG